MFSRVFKQGFRFRSSKPTPSISELVEPSKRRLVGSWLLLSAAGVFAMVVVGGYTRLTHSGLSIVDWSPYTKKYPRSLQEWDVEFEKYKHSVEYKTVNNRMGVDEFKRIYTVEYVHRKIGVYLGYVFAFPFAAFAFKGWIKPRLAKRLLMLLGLGALQGGIGFWMVRSGVDKH
jgi:cytochrome c oxidase assembly protein subunit 15